MVWSVSQTAAGEANDVLTGDGVTATFSLAPTEGSELVAFGIARPQDSAASTNVLSMSGWTKVQQQDTSSHSIAIFHKTAAASEPAAHTMTATMTDATMDAVLVLYEVTGGAFGTLDINENSNTASNVSSFSDSFTPPDASARFVASIGTIRRSAASDAIAWDATLRPANDPYGLELPTAQAFAFIARTGWEEITSTATRTWEVETTGTASAAMIIVGWPEAGGSSGATVTVAAPVTATGSVEAPAASASSGATIAVGAPVDSTTSVEAAGILAVTAAAPDVVTAPGEIPQASGNSHVSLSDAVSGDVVVLMPTASGSSSATIEPTAVDSTPDVQAPSVSTAGDASILAAAVEGLAATEVPTVSAASDATVSASTVSAPGSIESPTVAASDDANPTPSTVTSVGSVDMPTVSTQLAASISPLVLTAVGRILDGAELSVSITRLEEVGTVRARIPPRGRPRVTGLGRGYRTTNEPET